MSQNLLKDVIFRQAGTVLKSIEEAVQNSIDAGSKNIHINVLNKGMVIIDDGCGMNAEEIKEHFRVFGNSSKKDEKSVGQFGMGRGQVFAQGVVRWSTLDNIMITDCINSLSYKLRKSKKTIKGTKITVMFYRELSDNEVMNTTNKLRTYIINDKINIYINGVKLFVDFEVIKEDSNFVAFTCKDNVIGKIYSQSLYVKDFYNLSGFCVNCKNKMELNFARNEFLQTKSTDLLYKFINKVESDFISKKNNFNSSEAYDVLKFISEGKLDYTLFSDKKIVELVDGTMTSLSYLSGKVIMFSRKTKNAENALLHGNVVITSNQETLLENLKRSNKISFMYSQKTPDQMYGTEIYEDIDEAVFYKKHGLKQLKYWFVLKELNERVFGSRRYLVLAGSNCARAWTDGISFIRINYTELNCYSKEDLLYKLFGILCHEYAHDCDDKGEVDHDGNFYKEYHNISREKLTKFGNFLKNYNLNNVEDDYCFEIDEIVEKSKEIEDERKVGRSTKKILGSLFVLTSIHAVSTKDVVEKTGMDETYVSEVLCKLNREGVVKKLSRSELDFEPENKRTRSFWILTDEGKQIINS